MCQSELINTIHRHLRVHGVTSVQFSEFAWGCW